MGEKRYKADGPVIYHITSRIIHKRRLLGEVPREVWVRSLHRAAAFSGVELITYCVLPNHFHILVRVDPGAKGCDDATLVRRFRALYGTSRASWCQMDAAGLGHALGTETEERAERLRERLRRRMGDVSEFMRTLRQRYTRWFNQTFGTAGTLWAERFGAVVVEDTPWVVALVAAYVDLNPVRAGLAKLPEHYVWSGYAEAMAGSSARRKALAACFPRAGSESESLAHYRLLMLGKGAATKRDGTGARIDREELLRAVAAGGELPPHELLQLKAEFFSRGRAFGTLAWMESGEGARVLESLDKSPAPTPLEVTGKGELAVGCRRYRDGGVRLPSG